MQYIKDWFKGTFSSDSEKNRTDRSTGNQDAYQRDFPEHEKYLGFENESASICYANSAVQCLYHCLPLRRAVLDYKPIGGDPNRASNNNDRNENNKENNNESASNGGNNFGGGGNNNNTEKDMLYELHLLFKNLSSHKKQRGAYNHKRFMNAIKSSNALFDNDEHHDSHEFINWLLDKVHEDFLKNQRAQNNSGNGGRGAAQNQGPDEQRATSFVQELFMGKLQNVVTCVTCETTTRREETFFNLSLDIEQNSSLIYCMQRFSVKELLNQDNKLMCESCLTRQVATKEIMVGHYPKVLLVHLKRFRIDPQTFQQQKLNYRIPFPEELRVEGADGQHKIYHLKGLVVHEGQGLQFGHYYAIIKSQGKWMKFDDTRVSIVTNLETQIYYGEPPLNRRSMGWPCAYMLFYESEDLLDQYFGPMMNTKEGRSSNTSGQQQPGSGAASTAASSQADGGKGSASSTSKTTNLGRHNR